MSSVAICLRVVVHESTGAAQAASRVSSSKDGSRWARKKEAEFCRSTEIGTQDLKLGLLRKLPKKLGQLCEVKLEPMEVSKGTGRGVGMTEPATADVAVGLGA